MGQFSTNNGTKITWGVPTIYISGPDITALMMCRESVFSRRSPRLVSESALRYKTSIFGPPLPNTQDKRIEIYPEFHSRLCHIHC